MIEKVITTKYSSKEAALLEIVRLKKEISILETTNAQLKKERDSYKKAYERWSQNCCIKILRKILRK